MFFSKRKQSYFSEEPMMMRFHRGRMRYVACDSDGREIDENDLSPKDKEQLAKQNKQLLERPELLSLAMQQSINYERAEELKSLGFPCNSFEVLYSDRESKFMSPEIHDYLTKLVTEEDVLIGVHRTGSASLDDIADILRGGLIVNSLNGGNTSTPIHLMNTVSYYPNNETILKEVINADAYKESLGTLLIKIPDEALSGNLFMIDSENGSFYLDPMYIVGFIPVGPNGELSEIISYYYESEKGPFKPITALYDDREYAVNAAQQATMSSGSEGTKK